MENLTPPQRVVLRHLQRWVYSDIDQLRQAVVVRYGEAPGPFMGEVIEPLELHALIERSGPCFMITMAGRRALEGGRHCLVVPPRSWAISRESFVPGQQMTVRAGAEEFLGKGSCGTAC